MEKLLINVKFEGNEKIYSYSSYDESIKAGDSVLVDSQGDLACVTVVGVKPIKEMTALEKQYTNNGNVKCVLSKLDLTLYEKDRERKRKKQALDEQMTNIFRGIDTYQIYKGLAQINDEFKKLFEEYESL